MDCDGGGEKAEIHAHFSASTVMNDMGGHLAPGAITSIKVVIVIGIIEDTQIMAAKDPRLDQMDVTF